MSRNLPQTLNTVLSQQRHRPFTGRYLKFLSVYFAGLTLSFPVQIFILKDFNLSDSINWWDFVQQIPFLNWACMASYTATSVALLGRSKRLWAYLTGAVLITGINNAFIAFAGWDYSAWQLLSGAVLFSLPLAPTWLSPVYRKMIWAQKSSMPMASPRFKKRWKIELVSPGQEAPTTGFTINISDSGALVHLLKESAPQNLFDVRLTEAHQGIVLDCKARRVRDDIIPRAGRAPIPVMGIEFLSLNEEQKRQLQIHLNKTKPA